MSSSAKGGDLHLAVLRVQEGDVGKIRVSGSLVVVVVVLVAQTCPSLCNPMDCSAPGSYVLGILQARIPQWVAMVD